MKINSYRDLIVWQKSILLVKKIYTVSKQFPKEEKYVMSPQIRKSAISVPSNIAEGYGRRSRKDYVRFLQISLGSLYELNTQVEILFPLEYIINEEYLGLQKDLIEIEKMLNSLISSIRRS
jgi:four helix bundle protein